MKELRFRAWAHHSKAMFKPSIEDGWDLVQGSLYPLPNTTLMQYTGLSDKEGNEIYEGDILLIDHEIIADEVDGYKRMEPENLIEQVYWYKGKFVTEFDDIANTYEDAKVIGNIYENPELLPT